MAQALGMGDFAFPGSENETVRFWHKDKKLRRRVEVQCSLEEFIGCRSQHTLERYQHAVRSFGLFASRSLGQTCAAIFGILGRKRRPRVMTTPS